MSLKSLSQTRWKIEADQVKIYPYGVFYILSGVMAILVAGLLFIYLNLMHASVSDGLPLIIISLLIVFIFWGYAGTSVEFDNGSGKMRKNFMGFIPVKTIPFEKLHGINPVTTLGSYKYHLFRKDAKYGKGIAVSSSYTKNDDSNALAFLDEAVDKIHGFLDARDGALSYVPVPITAYKYFDKEGDTYVLKSSKIGGLVIGLPMIAAGIHELTPYAWLGNELSAGRIICLIFLLIGGAAIALAGFTRVTLDTQAQKLERKSPIGLGNKSYAFADYDGIQTVRKSMNFIYSGTDLQMYFLNQSTHKVEAITVQSFYRTSKIDRFIQEVNSIMFPEK